MSEVTGETKIPPNWKAVLQNNTNKKELFALLTNRVADFVFSEDMHYLRRICYFKSSRALQICRDVTIRKPTRQSQFMFYTHSTKDTIKNLSAPLLQILVLSRVRLS